MPPNAEESVLINDAFISYSRKDREFAAKLEKALRNYNPPKGLNLPQRNLVVFRDEEDFTGGEYHASLEKHLKSSRKMIVICSPHARQSRYVNDEIRLFAKEGGSENIIPVLVSGIPNNEAKPELEGEKAFPEALCEVMEMPLAASYIGFNLGKDNVKKGVFYGPWYKILADLYDISRSELEERDKKRKARQRNILISTVSVVFLIVASLAIYAWMQKLEAVKQMRIAQANLAMSYLKQARQDLVSKSPLRALAYVAEAYRVAPFLSTTRYMLSQAIRILSNHNVLAVSQSGLKNAHINTEKGRALLLGNDGVLEVWDYSSKKRLSHIAGNFSERDSISLSSDGTRVIAKQNGGMLRIWDAEQGKALFETKDYPKGSVRIISDLQCRRMVGIDEDYSAWVWDFSNGNLINKIDYNIWTADLSSNGQYLVTGSGNGMLGIWNAFNGQGIMFLEAPKDAQDRKSIWSFVKFDRNTNRVLAVNQSEAVIIDIANNPRESKFHRLIGQDNIDSGAFSPDGKVLATVSWDGTTVVWDSDTGSKIGTVQSHQREDLSGGWVGFSSDSKKMVTLAAGPRVAKIWDIESMKLMTSIDGPRGWILAVGFDIKENRLITADKDGALRSWSLGPDIQKSTKAAAKRLLVADFDGEATRIATADSQENNISVFDTSNGEVINQTGHKGARSIHTIAFSPDGRKVLSGGVGMGPQLWDLSSRDNPKDLGKISQGTFDVAFSPDGKRFVTSELNGTVRVWQDGQDKSILDLSLGGISAAAVSDGRDLVATQKKVITIFDMETKSPRLQLSTAAEDVVAFTFSPGGKRIAAAGRAGTSWVWDTDTGELVTTLSRHDGVVRSIRYSRDGRRLLTASTDGTVRVWDGSTGDLLALLQGGAGKILAVSEAKESDAVLAISDKGWIQQWNQTETGPFYEDIEKIMECYVPWAITQGGIIERTTIPAKCR